MRGRGGGRKDREVRGARYIGSCVLRGGHGLPPTPREMGVLVALHKHPSFLDLCDCHIHNLTWKET